MCLGGVWRCILLTPVIFIHSGLRLDLAEPSLYTNTAFSRISGINLSCIVLREDSRVLGKSDVVCTLARQRVHGPSGGQGPRVAKKPAVSRWKSSSWSYETVPSSLRCCTSRSDRQQRFGSFTTWTVRWTDSNWLQTYGLSRLKTLSFRCGSQILIWLESSKLRFVTNRRLPSLLWRPSRYLLMGC
jgi:hypothetical protein